MMLFFEARNGACGYEACVKLGDPPKWVVDLWFPSAPPNKAVPSAETQPHMC